MWFKKDKKEDKQNKSNEYLKDIIITKALRENKEKQSKIEELNKAIRVALENGEDLRKNLEVLQNTIEKIKEICKSTKSNVISKNKILKEIGE